MYRPLAYFHASILVCMVLLRAIAAAAKAARATGGVTFEPRCFDAKLCGTERLRRVGFASTKLPFKMGTNRRPLGRHDAIDAGIAQRAVRGALMAAQYAVELGPQPFNGTTALMIDEVRPEFDRQAIERVKGVGQQEQLGFRVQLRALNASRIPGRADLDPRARGIDIHVGGHPDDAAARALDDRERNHGPGRLQRESAFYLSFHAVRRRNARIPELPEGSITHGRNQAVFMRGAKGDQLNVLSDQCGRVNPGAWLDHENGPLNSGLKGPSSSRSDQFSHDGRVIGDGSDSRSL